MQTPVTERDGRHVLILTESPQICFLVEALQWIPSTASERGRHEPIPLGEIVDVEEPDEGPYTTYEWHGQHHQARIEYYANRLPGEHISDTLDRLGLDEECLLP